MEIFTIPILPFWLINAFLIKTPNGLILIDSGLPGTEKKIEKILLKNNFTFSDIKLIVVTHAHVDHAGNALKIQELSWAKIVGHENELQYFLGEKEMTFCSTWWFGDLFFKTNLIQEKYRPFTPDILLNKNEIYDLRSLGISWYIWHSPGHTNWSISVFMNTHWFVWDLISSWILLWWLVFRNNPKQPPFEENPKEVATQLEEMIEKWIKKFYMWHGWPLTEKEVQIHVKNLRNKIKKSQK